MTYESILNELKKEQERQKAIKEKLKAMKELSLNNRKEKKKSKKDLQETKRIIETYLQRIDVATTFSAKAFFSFLLKFLEIVEQKEMEVAEVVQDYSLEIDANSSKKQKNWFINQMLLDPRDKYILLAGKEEVEQIKNLLNTCTLMAAMETVPMKKYIFIPSDNEEVHLANGVELNKEWHRFPEIKYVFERLIELELETEQKENTEEERKDNNENRLESILQEVLDNKEEAYNRIRLGFNVK